MGLANMFVLASTQLEEQIRPSATEKDLRFLTIGTMDFWATWGCLKKCGIRTIPREDLLTHERCAPEEFNASSKKMCGLFFKHFGYNHYEEMDINDRADLLWNLNDPIGPELDERYDFVLNVSGQYAMNAIQSYWNTMRMVKPGGKLMVQAHLGDMTNRFYLNPSPDFLMEFHGANGFVLEKSILQNRLGFSMPYEPVKTKVTFLSTLIPLRYFVVYYLQQIIRDIPLRMEIARKRRLQKKEGTLGPVAATCRQERQEDLKKRLTSRFGTAGFQRLKRWYCASHRFWSRVNMPVSPDWVVWCVFRKMERVEKPRFQVLDTYRTYKAVVLSENLSAVSGV